MASSHLCTIFTRPEVEVSQPIVLYQPGCVFNFYIWSLNKTTIFFNKKICQVIRIPVFFGFLCVLFSSGDNLWAIYLGPVLQQPGVTGVVRDGHVHRRHICLSLLIICCPLDISLIPSWQLWLPGACHSGLRCRFLILTNRQPMVGCSISDMGERNRVCNSIYFWREITRICIELEKMTAKQGTHTVRPRAKSTFCPCSFITHWVQMEHSSFSRATSMIRALKDGGTVK